jgi:hypothetical protein
VKQVVKARMLATEEQTAALRATLTTSNEAASWLSSRIHAQRVRNKHEVQKRFYTELKQRFGLSAQPAIRVIGKVADAYGALRANIDAGNYGPAGAETRKKVAATPIGFRADAAQPFDARCLSWQIPEQVGGREATVSIWTTHGRQKGVRVLAAPKDLALLRTHPIGETDLIHRDGKWYLQPPSTCRPRRRPIRSTDSSGWTWVSSTSPPPATVTARAGPASTATASVRRDCGNACKPRKHRRRVAC